MALIFVLTTFRLILKSPAPTSPLTPDLYIQFLLEFSIWMSNRHLTFNIPKSEFLILSLPTCSFLSLPYLSKWQLFYLLKLQGYYFLFLFLLNPIHQQTLWNLISKYIQNMTTSYYLYHYCLLHPQHFHLFSGLLKPWLACLLPVLFIPALFFLFFHAIPTDTLKM